MGIPMDTNVCNLVFKSTTLAPFSYIGVWGYSLVTYSLTVGIYLLFKNIKVSIYFVLPFILILSLSNFIPRKLISVVESFHIRLVQPNIKQTDKWDKTKTLSNLNLLINLTRHHYKKNIDLVVWPETAVLFDIMDEGNTSLFLRNSFKNIENIIVGGIRKDKTNENRKIYNSLFLIDNISNTIDYHDKIKLVPFGEYIHLEMY